MPRGAPYGMGSTAPLLFSRGVTGQSWATASDFPRPGPILQLPSQNRATSARICVEMASRGDSRNQSPGKQPA